jgi:hypothetical protein
LKCDTPISLVLSIKYILLAFFLCGCNSKENQTKNRELNPPGHHHTLLETTEEPLRKALPAPSKEEIERRISRMQRIESVYWERAPVLLEEIFQEEKPDVAWTRQVRERIEHALSGDILHDTRLQFSECHRSLCKAVVRHKNENAYNTFKEKGADMGPWTGNLHGKKDFLSNGEIMTTVYFSRAGDNSPFEKMKDRMLEMVEYSKGGVD